MQSYKHCPEFPLEVSLTLQMFFAWTISLATVDLYPWFGGTLHKFRQGCSFEDIFGLPPKITGFNFKPQKNNMSHISNPKN